MSKYLEGTVSSTKNLEEEKNLLNLTIIQYKEKVD